jgi:hypothetical protein
VWKRKTALSFKTIFLLHHPFILHARDFTKHSTELERESTFSFTSKHIDFFHQETAEQGILLWEDKMHEMSRRKEQRKESPPVTMERHTTSSLVESLKGPVITGNWGNFIACINQGNKSDFKSWEMRISFCERDTDSDWCNIIRKLSWTTTARENCNGNSNDKR